MIKRQILLFIGFLLTIGLAINMVAWADMSPPPPAPGSNIAPGQEITQVSMVSERVETELVLNDRQPELPLRPPDDFMGGTLTLPGGCFHNNSTYSHCEDYDFYRVKVKAHFQMRNLGQETEHMDAEFPLKSVWAFGGGADSPTIENIRIYVDDEETPTGSVERPNPLGENLPLIPWATFPVTFPPGKDVLVDVVYDSPSLDYVLETGAGWKDDIGDAVLIFRMPYDVAPDENITIIDFGAEVTVKEKEAQWRWRHLEPTSANNWSANITNPFVWLNLQEARAAAKANPDDPNAWEHRAWAAWWAALDEKGRYYGLWTTGWRDRKEAKTWQFVEEATAAYEKAARLAPDDPDLQARYLRFRLANGLSWSKENSEDNIQRAAELARLVDDFAARFPGYPAIPAMRETLTRLWPDPTPVPTLDMRVLGPTSSPGLTATSRPTTTPTPKPQPTTTSGVAFAATATSPPPSAPAPIMTPASHPRLRSQSATAKTLLLLAFLAGAVAVALIAHFLKRKNT